MSVVEGRTLTADIDRGCDVCIVGSGAGGSVLAAGLCARGLDVVMVEEGPYRTSKDFDLEERHAYTEMYQDRGLRTSEDGAVIVLQGRTVGGGTTVNWTTCFRTPDETLAHWRDHHGLDLAPETLRPHFEAVEARLGIAAWPEELANANNQVLLRGARKLGYSVAPLRRNVRGCINSGYCGVGCAWDAKQSMIVTYLPDAFAHGLTLYSDMRADRIEMNHDRAGLVSCSALDGRERTGVRLRIRPRVVVVAGGAINTPAFLLRSEFELHAKIGHRTFLHPTVAVTGRYREAIDGWSGAPQSVGSHHFFQRGEEVGYFLECPPLQPVLASSALSAFGADQLVYMQNLKHVSGLIALMVDGWHEDAPGGVVRLASDGRPRVDYPFTPRVVRAMKDAMATMTRIHLAAGASTVITLHGKSVQVSSESDLNRLEAASYGPHEHVIFTAHQMGGAAMGGDPLRHPVDPQHRLRETQNVFVVDGSVFPTALGVNPSETIYALAHRAVDFVAAAVWGWIAAGALALVLVALYWPALDGQVLNWDDRKYLGDPLLQASFVDAVRAAFSSTFDHAWYPLLRLGWWADRGIGNRHVVDLALFVGSALAVARLLVELGVRRTAAYTAVLLWAVHPLRVESVAWLTSRKDVQSLFFVALCALAAIRGWRVASVLLFAVALLSKSLVAPVSVVIAAIVWLRSRRTWGVALIVLAVGDLAVARWALAGEATPWPYDSWTANAGVALHAHGDLIRRILWPSGLAAIYPLPEHPWPLTIGGVLVVLVGAIAAWRTRPWGLVLLALWVLPLLPVTGMVPLRFWGPDRYTLIPALAPTIAVVLLAGRFAPVLGVLAIPLIIATRTRIPDWHDSEALWERDAERPGDHWARRVNLGSAYGAAARFQEALVQYTAAKELAPDRPEVVAHYLFASVVVGGLGGDRSKVGNLLEPYPPDAVGWQLATAGLVHIGEGKLALEAARMARQEGAPEEWVQQAEARARALEH